MRLINVLQLSEILNVKRNTIYDWIYKKRIPYYKVEGSLRFDYEEILKWLATKKQPAHAKKTIV